MSDFREIEYQYYKKFNVGIAPDQMNMSDKEIMARMKEAIETGIPIEIEEVEEDIYY